MGGVDDTVDAMKELFGDLIETASVDDGDYADNPYQIGVPGTIFFRVMQNLPKTPDDAKVFEIEVLESTGCASWAEEGTGLEWWVEYEVGTDRLQEGHHYVVSGMSVTFHRGDGWETDDDEEWYYEELTRLWLPRFWITNTLSNIMHRRVRPLRAWVKQCIGV